LRDRLADDLALDAVVSDWTDYLHGEPSQPITMIAGEHTAESSCRLTVVCVW
jgi:hypothetical protein